MTLKLKIQRRDVVRIGDTLIGIDVQGPDFIVIIDAPQDQKIVRLPEGMSKPFWVLKEQAGMKPRLVGDDAEPDPAA